MPAPYEYDGVVLVDATGKPLPGGAVKAYPPDTTDFANATPLTITSLAGTALTNGELVAGEFGVTSGFRVTGEYVRVALYAQGVPVMIVASVKGIDEKASAALTQAVSSAQRVDDFLANPPVGSGGVTTVDTLGGATAIGKAVVKAGTVEQARQAIGAGTSSLAAGWGAGQAAPAVESLRAKGTSSTQVVETKVQFTQAPLVPADAFEQDVVVGLTAALTDLQAKVDALTAAGGGTGGGGVIEVPDDPDPVLSGLIDNFSGTTFDTSKWPTRTQPELSSLTGGRLRLVLGGRDSGGFTDVVSPNGVVDLTGSYAMVKVATVMAGGANNRELGFMLTDGAGKYVSMFAANPAMGMALRYNTYGTDLNLSVTLPLTEVWWRIRHDGTNLLWDTSADGVTWTNRRTVPDPGIDYTALTLRLYAGTRGTTEAGAPFGEFDEVHVGKWGTPQAPPPPPPLVEVIDFTSPTLRTTSYGPLVGATGTAYNIADAVYVQEVPRNPAPWETGTPVPQRQVVLRGSDVPGTGAYKPTSAARFEVRKNDQYASASSQYADGWYRTSRSEFRQNHNKLHPVGVERHIDFSYAFGAGFQFGNEGGRPGDLWVLLAQLKTMGGQPPLAIELNRRSLRLAGIYGGYRIITSGLTPGSWGNVKISVVPSTDPAVGWVEVRHNDAVVIPKTFMRTTDAGGWYFKGGIYRDSRWNSTPNDQGGTGVDHVLWMSSIRIGTTLASVSS